MRKTKDSKVSRGSVLVVILCLLTSMCFAQTTRTPPPTVSLEIESCGEWIEGLPLWLVITFKNNSKEYDETGPSHLEMGEFKPINYSWKLNERGGGPTVFGQQVGIWPRVDRLVERTWPGILIPSNGSYRMVFPLQWNESISEGKFELSVSFNKRSSSSSVLCSATTSVAVRQATNEEMSFIDLVRPCALHKWRQYPVPRIEEMPKSLYKAFGFELLLREAAGGKEPISALDPERFRLAETTLFDPELAAARYEILMAQQKKEVAMELRKKTLALYPGVERLFRETPRMLRRVREGWR